MTDHGHIIKSLRDQFLVAFSLVDSYFIVWRNVPYANGILGRILPFSFYFGFPQRKTFRGAEFLQYNFEPNVLIVGYPSDMYISKRFSSEVKSTKVTQKMDKIVSVTNKNIYRESLLTSSKLEKMPRDWHFHLIIIYIFEIFCFFYFLEKKNEYQADGLNYTRNPGFKEKRYGLDCIEPWKRIGAETQWKLIIVNLFQSNIEESPILHCDKNSMNLMLFIK
ncbi:hypothetical protein ACJX0J_002723 [Zea mays]